MKPSQLFTAQAANNGVALAIKFPNGTPTGQTITVRGTDSPQFQSAAREKNKARIEILTLPQSEQEAAFELATVKLMTSLVVDWSLEGECDSKAVEELFTNAPDVMEQVDSFCTKRANFFTMPPKS